MKQLLKYYIKDSILLGLANIKLSIFTKQKPILVFTMAKVGSLSVYFSLKKWIPKTTLFHIHSINVDEVKKGIQRCFEKGIYPGSKSPVFLINKKIIKKKRPFKVICLFRDPIERNISAFFDAFEFHTGIKAEEYDGSLEELKQNFYNKLNHKYPLQWFEKQFFEATNIDVYANPFDKEKGYQIIKKDHIEVLLMNSNLNDTLKETLIADFCKRNNFQLNNRNVSATKEYAAIYKDFKSKVKFSKVYLEKLYNSNFAKHFFTEKHSKEQIEKWSE